MQMNAILVWEQLLFHPFVKNVGSIFRPMNNVAFCGFNFDSSWVKEFAHCYRKCYDWNWMERSFDECMIYQLKLCQNHSPWLDVDSGRNWISRELCILRLHMLTIFRKGSVEDCEVHSGLMKFQPTKCALYQGKIEKLGAFFFVVIPEYYIHANTLSSKCCQVPLLWDEPLRDQTVGSKQTRWSEGASRRFHDRTRNFFEQHSFKVLPRSVCLRRKRLEFTSLLS